MKPVTTNQPAVSVGATLPVSRTQPTTIQLFRFSAATWNAHRIHYDQAYARTEGYPDVLVQSHLHGCLLLHAALNWAGPTALVRAFRWENRGIAIAGDELSITGTVTAVAPDPTDPDRQVVTIELAEHTAAGVLCAPATAVLSLPTGGRQ